MTREKLTDLVIDEMCSIRSQFVAIVLLPLLIVMGVNLLKSMSEEKPCTECVIRKYSDNFMVRKFEDGPNTCYVVNEEMNTNVGVGIHCVKR